ncbi:carbohydrate ABC transporter permease [Streptomyces sp. BE20]|uniref:carbohydrate ABC transporter permease n=1 Tax=Streptomyces sp. BE20 TaxID=3002525 RepID=UPI002E782A34|nr:carbohydrate ABC transporter permease [Streptomyces sp. BE20]MEE1820853.1 carbohydrate ABC transporter permease [Streptomyces sp. BE20]
MTSQASWVRPVAAIGVTAVFCLPLYVALVNVFKPSPDIIASPLALPTPPTLDNIHRVLSRPDGLYWYGLINSITLTAASIIITTVLAAMSAYYLVRSEHWWSRGVLAVMLTGLMIPAAAIMLPITRILDGIGLLRTMPGAVLVNVGYYLPFAVFVFMGFIRSIPRELEEAAAVDGAGRLRTFWQIVFPLLRPASASVLILLGVWVWNDFLTPLLVLGPGAGNTVTVGVFRSIGPYQQDFGAVFAFMLLATLPVLVFYLAFQKYFVRGLTGGATKG